MRQLALFYNARADFPQVALLPYEDPLLKGYVQRQRFGRHKVIGRAYRGGSVAPTVVIEGEIAALWRFSASGRGPTIHVQTLVPIERNVLKMIEDRLKRWLTFSSRGKRHMLALDRAILPLKDPRCGPICKPTQSVLNNAPTCLGPASDNPAGTYVAGGPVCFRVRLVWEPIMRLWSNYRIVRATNQPKILPRRNVQRSQTRSCLGRFRQTVRSTSGLPHFY